jgi:sporulation protein YlmC with PRC-barrel domain
VKTSFTALTVSLLALALAAGVSAQTSRPSSDAGAKRDRDAGVKRDSTSATHDTTRSDDKERRAWSPAPNAVESSKLVGTTVRTTDGKDIGEISDVIVNRTSARITHVVLTKGGVLGVGGEKLVLPWSEVKLQHDTDNADRWIALVDPVKLDRAPRYEAAKNSDSAPSASPRTTTPPRTK